MQRVTYLPIARWIFVKGKYDTYRLRTSVFMFAAGKKKQPDKN